MDGQLFTPPAVVITRDDLASSNNESTLTLTPFPNDTTTGPDNNITMTTSSTTTVTTLLTTDSDSVANVTSLPEDPTTSIDLPPETGPSPVQCPDLLEDFIASEVDQGHDLRPSNVNVTSVVPQAMAVASQPIHSETDATVTAVRPLVVTSRDRTPGTVVRAKCTHGYLPSTLTYLECQPSGVWNGTLPACHTSSHSITINTLYFAVIGGVCSLSLLVLAVLYCHLLKGRKKKDSPLPPSYESDRAIYVDPYAIGERLYAAPAPLHYARSDITYAKPKIYTTYLDPAFREDAYDRWRRQEQQVAEKLYDSPWLRPRNSQNGTDNSNFRWNQTSTKTRGEARDYDRFRRLPRAQLSMDQQSVKSTDSFGQPQTQIIPMSRSRGHYGRQGSTLSSHSIKFQNMNTAEPPLGPPPPLPSIEYMDMSIGDGRTQF